MRIAALLVCVFVWIDPAFAQDRPAPVPWSQPLPSPTHGDVHPLPATPTPAPPLSAPAAGTSVAVMPHRVSATPPIRASQEPTARLEHLLEAAVHLEAAGESRQAQEIRQLVTREREALSGRLSDVAPGTSHKQVMIEVRVLEVARSKLRKLGFDFTLLQGDRTPKRLRSARFAVLQNSAGLSGLLEVLREDNLVRVLAEPTLVGISGRPVTYHSGGEVPVKQASGQTELFEYGIRADFVPLVMESGNIRLEMKVLVSDLLEPNPDKPDLPRTSTQSIDTAVEMKSGQTCVMSGLTHRVGKPGNDSAETTETLYLITPRVLN